MRRVAGPGPTTGSCRRRSRSWPARLGRAARCHDRRMAWRIDPEGVETAALAKAAPVNGLRVLELGCGDGRLTFRYAEAAASVLAVDPDAERITEARASLPSQLAERVT